MTESSPRIRVNRLWTKVIGGVVLMASVFGIYKAFQPLPPRPLPEPPLPRTQPAPWEAKIHELETQIASLQDRLETVVQTPAPAPAAPTPVPSTPHLQNLELLLLTEALSQALALKLDIDPILNRLSLLLQSDPEGAALVQALRHTQEKKPEPIRPQWMVALGLTKLIDVHKSGDADLDHPLLQLRLYAIRQALNQEEALP